MAWLHLIARTRPKGGEMRLKSTPKRAWGKKHEHATSHVHNSKHEQARCMKKPGRSQTEWHGCI